jgi:hypothetical protein
MRKRVSSLFVAGAPAEASHYPGHECSVEIPRPSGGPICVPPLSTIGEFPERLYEVVSEFICVRTGQCTPVLELPKEVVCGHWSPPEYCPL